MTHKQLFENFISEQLDHIYRFAYGYMHSQADAEDAVNDSVIKAIKALDSLRSPEHLSTWFYRILINTCNTALKRRAKVIPMDPHSPEAVLHFDTPSAEHTPESWTEQAYTLDELISPLSPEDRTIVILRFLEDKPLAEIAEILDINLSTVKTRLYRALNQLRITLSPAQLEHL